MAYGVLDASLVVPMVTALVVFHAVMVKKIVEYRKKRADCGMHNRSAETSADRRLAVVGGVLSVLLLIVIVAFQLSIFKVRYTGPESLTVLNLDRKFVDLIHAVMRLI